MAADELRRPAPPRPGTRGDGPRDCACGGRPAWTRHERRARFTGYALETLRCPRCGNATGPLASRQRLTVAWNGWQWRAGAPGRAGAEGGGR